MRNLKVYMSYRGTRYHGFQRQENALAVQEVVENALSQILNEPITVYGCSRTDTGVHAKQYCFNFYTMKKIPERGIILGTNKLLADDISILSCEEEDLDFHARYSCKGKEYVYKIHADISKDPFSSDLALHYRNSVDIDLMREAAKYFIGKRDFAAFCSSGSEKQNTVRTIYDFSVSCQGKEIEMLVKGDGFLYNMVRIMVGTLLFVNEGKIQLSELEDIFASKDRTKAGKTAQAHGLYLNKIYY